MDLDAPFGAKGAILRVTPRFGLETAASFLLSVAGMWLLASGRKEHSLDTMLLGAALILGAMFLF